MSWEERPARRPLSVTQRRDLMWNFTQPGDPYDIRKSMIAKLPGQKKPMAPHLELVCLLQAAEIERLSQCLEEFQMRLREGERIELDRHSYEVQIKELTQKIGQDHNARSEIQKLKEFIRRQTIQLEQQRRLAHDSQLSNNYQDSLREIAELTSKNNLLQQTLRVQEEQRSREVQISKEQKSQFLASLSRSQRSLKEISFKLQTQKQQIELESKSAIQAQQEILKSLEDQNSFYKKQIERLQLEATKAKQLSQTISEYQNRFQIIAEQIDRLNQVLRNKTKQLNEQYARSNQLKEMNRQKDAQLLQNEKKIRQLYDNITKLQREQRQTVASLTDLEQHKSLVHSYQASLEKLSIEVDRLNNVLRKKLAELEETRRKANDLQVKVRSLEASQRQSGQFRLRASEANRKLSTFERDNARIVQQNQRLDYTLKKLIEEMNHHQLQAEGQLKQNDNLRQAIDILNSQINKQRDEKKQMSDHISRYQEIIQQSKLTYERKLEEYRIIIKQLQAQIDEKSHEAASAKSSQSQTQLRLKQAESVSENDQQYIQQLINTKRQLEDRLQQAQIVISKLEQQSRPPMIDQGELISRQYEEIERLNDVLLIKQKELKTIQQELQKQQSIRQGFEDGRKGLLIELSQLQEKNHIFQQQLIKKQEAVTYYLNDNQIFYKENAQLKNNIEERDIRIERLQIQLDKLNQRFRSAPKSPEKSSVAINIEQQNILLKERYDLLKYQTQNDQLKIQSLKQQIINLRYELDQLHKNSVIDSRLSPSKTEGNQNAFDFMAQKNQMLKQIEFLRQNCDTLNHDNSMMHNEIIFLRDQTSKMQSQVTYGGSGAKTEGPISPQKQVQLKKKNEQIAEYYSKILIFSEEIDRLNNILLLKQKQSQEKDSIIINLQTQFRSIPEEEKSLLSGQILQLEQSLKNYEMKQGQNMATRDQQRRLFEGKIEILQVQIIRLNDVLSSKIKENQEIRLNLSNNQRQLDFLHQNKKDSYQLQRIKNEYQLKIALMSQQIQRLNSLLQGKERNFSNMSQQYKRKESQNVYKLQQQSRKLLEADERLDKLNNEISGLRNRQHIQSLKLSNFSEFEDKIVELSGEVDRLNRILYSNKQRISELQSKQEKYLPQIQRLNNSLRLKVEESSFFEIKERSFIQEKQYLSKGRQSLQFQLKKATTQNSSFRQHISQYEKKIKELYEQFQRLQKVMSYLKTENEEIKRHLSSKQFSIQQLIEKNRYLGGQIQRLTNLNLKQGEQLSYFRLKISEDDYLQRRINEDLGLFVVLFAQIETLRLRVQEQIEENDSLRKQNIKSRLV